MASPGPTEITAAVQSGDRLSFTLFMAAALHGLFVFGLAFEYHTEPQTPPAFEVTLATHQSREAPEDADFQAQFNQEASGTLDSPKELTTDRNAAFSDTRVREVMPTPEVQATKQALAEQLERVETTSQSQFQLAERETTDQRETQQEREGKERDIPKLSTEIASLRAKLARQRQEYANKPRIRRLTSVSTRSAADAAYLNHWRERVETVGNQNFPQQAVDQGIYGQLRLAARIKSNGTIVSVELLESSGHRMLDQAALQIVHMAAPFDPFPPEVAKNTDQLDIIRTWRFEITGLSTQ